VHEEEKAQPFGAIQTPEVHRIKPPLPQKLGAKKPPSHAQFGAMPSSQTPLGELTTSLRPRRKRVRRKTCLVAPVWKLWRLAAIVPSWPALRCRLPKGSGSQSSAICSMSKMTREDTLSS
jgi:hypothetical protein